MTNKAKILLFTGTPLLALLDRYGVKATFFMTGEKVEANPAIALSVHRKGHLVIERAIEKIVAFLEEFAKAVY